MKNIIRISTFLFPILSFAQVLITDNMDNNPVPDPSAVLELRSADKGLILPSVPITSDTDLFTMPSPKEGSFVFVPNSYYDYQDLPNTFPTYAVFDGTHWLMNESYIDATKALDYVNNFNYENTTSYTLTNFPSTALDPSFALGENISAKPNWQVLIDSSTSENPYFNEAAVDAQQSMLIDVEGLATISTATEDFAYAIGIFVDDELKAVRKIYKSNISGFECYFSKFNVYAVINDDAAFTKDYYEEYNVKVAAMNLKKSSGQTYNSITFGDSASGCNNLNLDTAKIYMNILIIDKPNP